MPITEAQLSARIHAIRNYFNNDPNVDVVAARQAIANEEADAINDFVIGRTTNVTGTSATGGAVTGTGTIQ